MEFTKIEGHPDLVRDNRTNSIINTNKALYKNYLISSKVKQDEKTKIESIESDLKNIKSEMSEVKEMLNKILNYHFNN